MERRKILAAAGAITATVLAGTAAVAANVGLLDSAGNGKVGELSPVVNTDSATTTAPPEIETVIVDEPVSAAAPSPSTAPSVSTAPHLTAPAGSATSYDDHFEDDHFEDDDHGDDKDDHEDDRDEPEEHGGRDDDD